MAEQEKADTSKQSDDAKTRKSLDQKSAEQTQGANAQQSKAESEKDQEKDQDAITLLKNDHRAVEGLFAKFESASRDAEKIMLARQVCQELIIHTIIEEEIFYPACREHVDESKLDEAQVEHDSAKSLINELLSASPDSDEYFDAKVKVLAEQIKHHVEEEEKRADGLFAKAKAGGLDIEDLGRRLAARKAELKEQAERRGLGLPRQRSFRAFQHYSKEEFMPQSTYRERDRQGRFTSEDDDDRRTSRGRNSDRDDYGRYARDDDDDRRSRSSGRTPDRDEYGRFVSDDDDRGSSRSRGSYGRSRDDDDDRNSRSSRNGGAYGRSRDDDDDRRSSSASRNRDQGSGWYGDPEGHSEASRRGWRNSDHEGSGWYGDSRAHSDASRRGWQNSDHEGSGWYGDPEGHSEASRRGWENREGSRGRSRYDDDDRNSSRSYGSRGSYSRSRDDDDDRRGRGQGGWFGDPEGHSEASRRGWRERR